MSVGSSAGTRVCSIPRKVFFVQGYIMNILHKDLVVLAVVTLSICASTDGIGCPEPVVYRAQIEFSDSPGKDGLYPWDTIISVQCNMGASMKGNRFVRCLETDTWATLPTCIHTTGNVKCPLPPKPWNGQIKRVGRRGALVSCNPGFTLYGKRRIRCAMTATGVSQWPRTLCRARNRCNNPGNITDGDWEPVSDDGMSNNMSSQFSPNTIINVTCTPGFALVGNPLVYCGMDGRWNSTIPTCEEIRCPPLVESIPHGGSEMMNRTYKQGEIVDYFCDTGYRIFGKTTRVCSLDSSEGTWSHLNPDCEEILCPHPGRIQYGESNLESRSIGGSVSFFCNSGYKLRGSPVRHCLAGGKWSGKLTTCDHESFYCPNPGVPIGGYIENQDTPPFQRGGVVRYACYQNRALVGSAERYCNTSTSWSGEEPECRGQFDFDEISDVAERMGYVAESLAIETSEAASVSKGRTLDQTYSGGYDIYFAFDASGSIAKAHFEKALDFAKLLVKKIGVSNARYAASAYATSTVHSLLISDAQDSEEAVLAQIDSLADARDGDIGTGTATGKALQYIHTDMIPLSERYNNRPNAKRALFLFSDGHTNTGASEAIPKHQAMILREDYEVQIHCIGVTHEVDISELQDIASKPLSEHLFLIADYNELNLLVQTITEQKLDYSECGYNGGPKNAVRSKGRISGGDNAPLYQWPWQVAIYKEEFGQKTFFCGGTIIAPNWVLTAAHCLEGKPWDIIRVYTGVNDRSSIRADNPAYEVDGEDSYKVHENFQPSSLANDIALLRLSGNSTLGPKVRTICVPQADTTEESLYTPRGEAPYVTGWGVTEPYDISLIKDSNKCDYSHDETSTNRLQQLQIPVVTNEECKRSLRDKAYLCSSELDFKENVSFCAGYSAGGQDACEGDSGGPVVRELLLSDGTKRWVQIGIVSWGEGCGQEGRYGFYTKLSKYINWIHQHVGNSISFDINN
ncbi:complement C2-like [Asterias amurensis]|uniref:complement C2-like n=1 Tax=Asterias amurensis TaxID=7602 RepID=UPI003AB75AF7